MLFSVLAILSGGSSYRKIAAFIYHHYDLLDDHFGLNWKRCPAYTTIRDIIQGTSASELEKCFRAYSAYLVEGEANQRFIAADGKVLRGSFDHFEDQKAIQILSVFLSDSHLILAHETIATKTNEIPVVQQLMTELGLSGYIFTLDALHCQQKTLQMAKQTGHDVIVQVKNNQPTLLADCQTMSQTTLCHDVYQEPSTKLRNRIEKRTVSVYCFPQLTHQQKWHEVKAVIKVQRYRRVFDTKTKTWTSSDEVAFYISTLVLSAQEFGHAIRNHWGIENRNHYVRDVTLGEDKSRIRTNPHILAKLRSFALNILRKNKVQNVSLELFTNCMNIENVLKYEGIN